MGANDEFGFGKHYFILDKKLENHINSEEAHNMSELRDNFNNLTRFLEKIFPLPESLENGTYVLKAIKSDEGTIYTWVREEVEE